MPTTPQPDPFCAEKAATIKGDWQWVRLFSGTQRNTVDALLALRAELAEIVTRSSEHELAHARLAWWEEECARVADGVLRHPISRQLATSGLTEQTLASRMRALLRTAAIELAGGPLHDANALLDYCQASGGTAAQLCLAPGADDTLHRTARDIGSAWALSRLLCRVRTDAQRGIVWLPQQALAQAGLNDTAQLAAKTPDVLRDLLAQHAMQAEALLADSAALSAPLRVLAALTRLRLGVLARYNYSLPEQTLDPPPLRMLWASWRAARQVPRH